MSGWRMTTLKSWSSAIKGSRTVLMISRRTRGRIFGYFSYCQFFAGFSSPFSISLRSVMSSIARRIIGGSFFFTVILQALSSMVFFRCPQNYVQFHSHQLCRSSVEVPRAWKRGMEIHTLCTARGTSTEETTVDDYEIEHNFEGHRKEKTCCLTPAKSQ